MWWLIYLLFYKVTLQLPQSAAECFGHRIQTHTEKPETVRNDMKNISGVKSGPPQRARSSLPVNNHDTGGHFCCRLNLLIPSPSMWSYCDSGETSLVFISEMAAALFIFTPNHKDSCSSKLRPRAFKSHIHLVSMHLRSWDRWHLSCFKKKLCDPTIILFVLDANWKRNTGIGDG